MHNYPMCRHRYQTLPLGSKSSICHEKNRFYNCIFLSEIWKFKCWTVNNGEVPSELSIYAPVVACWPVKVQTEGWMHLRLNYSINYGGDHILLMSVIYGGRQSCMIDVIYCGCPSLMNMMDVHHVWCMDASHICMMDVHHIWCFTVINFHPICEGPLWWKQWNI